MTIACRMLVNRAGELAWGGDLGAPAAVAASSSAFTIGRRPALWAPVALCRQLPSVAISWPSLGSLHSR